MKVAVSIPDAVFKAAEQLARQRKVARSRLYSEALAAYLGSQGADAVTAKLDAVYAGQSHTLDHALTQAQFRSIAHETW
jgi:predicted transcriptional regulator